MSTQISGLNGYNVWYTGPFVSSAGNYYAFSGDPTTTTTLNAVKAANPNSSWSIVATKTGFNTLIRGVSGFKVDDVVHLVVCDGTGTSHNVKYQTFNMANDTFVTAETAKTGIRYDNTEPCAAICVRSTGEVIAFYSAARKSGGTYYGGVYYTRRTGVNTWSAAVQVDPNTNGCYDTFCSVDANNIVNFLYTNGSTASGNQLSTGNVLSAGPTAGYGAPPRAVVYTNSSSQQQIAIGHDAIGTYGNFRRALTTDSSSTGSTFSGNWPWFRLFVDDFTTPSTPTLYAVGKSSDNKFYWRKSTDNGATWTDPVDTGITGNSWTYGPDYQIERAISRSGSCVLPFIWTDANSYVYYYDEVVITSEQDLTPNRFNDTETFYTPTIQRGEVALAPQLFSDADAFYAPIVAAALAPSDRFNDIDLFYAPTVQRGAVTLTPQLFTDADIFYAPTIQRGAVTITQTTRFDDTDIFYAPEVSRLEIQSLIPNLFSDTDTFYAPDIAVLGPLRIDELRITDGIARYSVSFDKPEKLPRRGTLRLRPDLFSDVDTFYAPTIEQITEQQLEPQLFSDTDLFYAPTVQRGIVTLDQVVRFDDTDLFYEPIIVRGEVALQPDLFDDVDTVYAPTIQPGAVTLTPQLFSDDDLFYAPTIQRGVVTLEPQLFSDNDLFYAPTIQRGAVTLQPDLFDDVDTIYAPIVQRGAVTLQPDLFDDTDAFYAPEISQTGATQFLISEFFDDNDLIYVPIVQRGAVTLTPQLFSDVETFYVSTIQRGAVTLEPDLFADADEFYSPEVVSGEVNGYAEGDLIVVNASLIAGTARREEAIAISRRRKRGVAYGQILTVTIELIDGEISAGATVAGSLLRVPVKVRSGTAKGTIQPIVNGAVVAMHASLQSGMAFGEMNLSDEELLILMEAA